MRIRRVLGDLGCTAQFKDYKVFAQCLGSGSLRILGAFRDIAQLSENELRKLTWTAFAQVPAQIGRDQ